MKHIISDVIYGGIDGIITTFVIMIAAIGSNQSMKTILILTLASLFADGISMGVSASESEVKNINRSFKRGIVTFISFILAGIIPIIVYYLTSNYKEIGFYITLLSFLVCLFMIGMLKAVVIYDNKYMFVHLIKTMIVGGIAGIISYYIAYCLENIEINE